MIGQARTRYGQGRGGRPWRHKRDGILQRDKHLCQSCIKAGRITRATEVDHIIPIAFGGTGEDSNLQAICETCHRAKTAQEANGGRPVTIRGCDTSGVPIDPAHPWGADAEGAETTGGAHEGGQAPGGEEELEGRSHRTPTALLRAQEASSGGEN